MGVVVDVTVDKVVVTGGKSTTAVDVAISSTDTVDVTNSGYSVSCVNI